MKQYYEAAARLHHYLFTKHWRGSGLVGPDPGVRFNARIGRFVKSYLRFMPWHDDLAYFQAQGYWIIDNWLMTDLDSGIGYEDIALTCSDFVLKSQQPQGYWEYPNPEWKGRIATVEGCWATLGLLETYDRVRREEYLKGAIRWYKFLINGIGFHTPHGMLAIRYFARQPGHIGRSVPNNTTLVLWTLARLAEVTDDSTFLETAPPMVEWLNHVQLESGELPYATGDVTASDRPHFLCYQYNAFEFIDLIRYYRITGDPKVWPVVERLSRYLSTGFTEQGNTQYDCFHEQPEVLYYTSAVARALGEAAAMGLFDDWNTLDQAFHRVLSQQKENGNFAFYSASNYGILKDRRSYPRYLVMILNHLLEEYQTRQRTRQKQQVTRKVVS